jgi:hypothetical protein
MQSGAGNNWAHGFHGYGPRVHEAAMELVRREVGPATMLALTGNDRVRLQDCKGQESGVDIPEPLSAAH